MPRVTAVLRIGLTGAVGAGKSTVLAWMREHGARVLDADHVVHRLLAEDEDLIGRIVRHFGPDVQGASGIERTVLAARVFASPKALAELEALVFPSVRRAADRWLAAGAGISVVEAVKLVESGMHVDFDQLWLITCARGTRRERLRARGWSSKQIDQRMSAGGPLQTRLAAADVVIDNSGTHASTRCQLAAAWPSMEVSA